MSSLPAGFVHGSDAHQRAASHLRYPQLPARHAQARGGRVVLAPDEVVMAEHSTLTEAKHAALAHLREGDEPVV
jgi:hypothetical protein